MRSALFLLLAGVLCSVYCKPVKAKLRGKAVEATVNGQTITSELSPFQCLYVI